MTRILLGISAPTALDTAASLESTACSGFPSDTYDRYVLGLLDNQERAIIDEQVERQCSACIAGIQRSMNLWLVFANSLEQVEPSADFRARLVRIAELSNRVLTVPKRHRSVREPAILISSLIVISLILTTLLAFTWIAGRQSYRQDAARSSAKLASLQGELAANTVKLNEQVRLNKDIADKLQLRQPVASSPNLLKVEDQLSKAQAEAVQYKEMLSRDLQKTTENSTLVTALSNPGVKLLTFKNAEGTPSTAYAFVVENARVIFVASNLAPPSYEHQYQLWLVRKEEKHFISAGLFSSSEDKSVVVTYDQDTDVITSLAGLLVTEEPTNGSSQPSQTKVLETPGAAAIAIPASTASPAN